MHINTHVNERVVNNCVYNMAGGKNVDKNIKAELESLRNEVVANLKNIEGLVGQIDTKLAEEETTSCLSRCPEIAQLLEICKTVKLHPETNNKTSDRFEILVNNVYEQMNAIAVDRYTKGMADLISVVKTMDSKIGKLAGTSPMEEYWENKFPGVRETVEQFLEEDGAVKPKKT